MTDRAGTGGNERRPRSARRLRFALVGPLLLVSFLAACGDDGDDGSGDGAARAPGDAPSEMPVRLEGAVNDEGTADRSGDGARVALRIEVDDSSFEPTFVKVAPGAEVEIGLENDGDAQHTFTTDDGQVDETLAPGATATVTVTAPDGGALRFHCDFHAGSGMQGAIYAEDGATVGPAASGDEGTGAATTTSAGSGRSDTGSGY